jgi:hypothetical protein
VQRAAEEAARAEGALKDAVKAAAEGKPEALKQAQDSATKAAETLRVRRRGGLALQASLWPCKLVGFLRHASLAQA